MSGPNKIDLLRALEVFHAVSDSGSMTAAAHHLKITQSAISQQLKLLESELRVTLIDRDTRPLRLTPAGQGLRQHAADLLLHADQVRAEVREIAAGPMPHLRIAMFGTLARTISPALIEAVVKGSLAIKTFSILRGMAVQHARELPGREVDMIITSNPLGDVDGLERHEIIHERFMLILPKGAVPRQIGLRELAARLPMIRYSARTEAGRLIEQHLRRLRLDVPQGHTFDAPDDLFAMISMGQGWAITPATHVVHAVLPEMPVELRTLPKPGLERNIVLIARKNELGHFPQKIAALCRRVLRAQYLPRFQQLMPAFAEHLSVTGEPDQSMNTE